MEIDREGEKERRKSGTEKRRRGKSGTEKRRREIKVSKREGVWKKGRREREKH